MRDFINLIEGRDPRIKVRGTAVYIDGVQVGNVSGGRYRFKGQITPGSGYYLKLNNGEKMYMNPGNEKYPAAPAFAYAEDLIRQIGYDADEILAIPQ